jgi:heme-degrading monooxygenase HmoA
MITRVWHGRTSTGNSDWYLRFLLNKGTEEYTLTPGNLSVKVWRQNTEDCSHFWTVTEWKDIDSIRAFAGEDYEKAVYYPEDEGILLEFEEYVIHTETHIVK